MSMISDEEFAPTADEVRRLSFEGASFVAVVDRIHERFNRPKYGRIITAAVLTRALDVQLRDVSELLACEIFGHGSTRRLADTERAFRELVDSVRSRQPVGK